MKIWKTKTCVSTQRIEGQAIQKTKQNEENDLRTHTRFLRKSERKGSQKVLRLSPGKGSFCFFLAQSRPGAPKGRQMVAQGSQKTPQSRPETPRGFQMVAQGCQKTPQRLQMAAQRSTQGAKMESRIRAAKWCQKHFKIV